MIQWSLGEAVVPSQHRWPEDAAGTPVQGRGQRGGCRRLESLDGTMLKVTTAAQGSGRLESEAGLLSTRAAETLHNLE